MMHRWVFAGLILWFGTCGAKNSHAQPAVVASTLFQQAITKMEAEQFGEACPLLEQSYKIDARLGTLFTLANCRDLEGKVASASARYGEYLRAYANMSETEQAKHQSRAAIAEARVRELENQLPLLHIAWKGDLPAKTRVLVDDFELPHRAPDLPLPLDPGPHDIIIEQAETPEERRTVMLTLGQETRFDVDAEVVLVKPLEQAPLPAPPPRPIIPNAPKTTGTQKIAGFIVLGAGGAGFLFGGIMGAAALDKKKMIDLHCPEASGYGCDSIGLSAVDDLRVYANASTVGIVSGAILTTVGVILVVTAPKGPREVPNAVKLRATNLPGGGWLGLGGTF